MRTGYSLYEGLKRAFVRAFKIGVLSGAVFFVNDIADLLPAEYLPFIPVIIAFLEKLERNHREIA